jgi:hypothetical protein
MEVFHGQSIAEQFDRKLHLALHRLGRLLSPFREKDPFTIRLDADEFPECSGELRSDILAQALYRIEARFDGDQTITLYTNRTGTTWQRWNGYGGLACGPVRVRLFVFGLEGKALARIGPPTEVRARLKEWTGVSIYRDGFPVGPCGKPHDGQDIEVAAVFSRPMTETVCCLSVDCRGR